MDVRIKDGDMVLDPTGNPVYISGAKEAFQRALFLIRTKAGTFVYNKGMGMSAVTSVLTERDRENLRAKLTEAVATVDGMQVYVTSAEELIDGTQKADITLVYKGEEYRAEVTTDGKL